MLDCEWNETYGSVSLVTELVQIAKLSLTLVELVKISLFKSNSGVSLINLNVRSVKLK